MKKLLLPFAVGAMFLASCGASADEAAEKACECVKDLDGLQEKAMAGEIGVDEIQTIQEESIKCLEDLKEEYDGKVDKDDLIEAMKEECPGPAKQMFGE